MIIDITKSSVQIWQRIWEAVVAYITMFSVVVRFEARLALQIETTFLQSAHSEDVPICSRDPQISYPIHLA